MNIQTSQALSGSRARVQPPVTLSVRLVPSKSHGELQERQSSSTVILALGYIEAGGSGVYSHPQMPSEVEDRLGN